MMNHNRSHFNLIIKSNVKQHLGIKLHCFGTCARRTGLLQARRQTPNGHRKNIWRRIRLFRATVGNTDVEHRLIAIRKCCNTTDRSFPWWSKSRIELIVIFGTVILWHLNRWWDFATNRCQAHYHILEILANTVPSQCPCWYYCWSQSIFWDVVNVVTPAKSGVHTWVWKLLGACCTHGW